MQAYTRAVSPRLDACALTHLARVPIDVARAAEQHAAYEEALLLCGCAVRRMPPLPDAPDGVFVEDTALLLDGIAVITRPGAASRVGETASVAATLAESYEVRHLSAGRLDGGDVLRVGRTLFVGLSQRTDEAGFCALRDIVAALGFITVRVPVGGALHLKSAVTFAGEINRRPVLVLHPDWIDGAVFGDVILCPVDPAEPWAANVLAIGGTVLMADGSPRTQARLAALGLSVETLETSELRKAEAGLTCMSLIGDR
jgi:dimethylargininase